MGDFGECETGRELARLGYAVLLGDFGECEAG
jgi:hypothetical protein